MKTNTKLLASAIALFGIIILITSFKKSSDNQKEYATIAITKTHGAGSESSIVTIQSTGLPESKEVSQEGGRTESLVNRALSINSAINELSKNGFRLVSSVNESGATYCITYIFFEK